MEANPAKSAVIVMGDDEVVEQTRQELRDNPVRLHGNPVDVKQSEPYLGFTLHQACVKMSINATAKLRIDKGWGKAASIKEVINNPAVSQFGWMRAGVTLFKAVIPSVITYSAETWIGCPIISVDFFAY